MTMASGIRSIEFAEVEDVKKASLRVGEYRGAIPTVSGIPSRELCDLEDIQTAPLREREYRRAIEKIY